MCRFTSTTSIAARCCTAEDRADVVRRLLEVLPDRYADGELLHQLEPGKISRLDELISATALGSARLPRPATPFSDAALMTNARTEPTLAAELRAEFASADHVDLLCAFVKWHGLRLLEDQLTELRERGVPLRVITTTYLGATDARALDRWWPANTMTANTPTGRSTRTGIAPISYSSLAKAVPSTAFDQGES